MKALIAGLLLVVGCGNDVEMFPVNPGGGGGMSGTGFVDAGLDLGDGNLSAMIAGRVCVLLDARKPRDCEATGAGGLTVTLGSFSAVTSDHGDFSIRRPTGTNLVWRVSGTRIAPAVMSLGSEALIPAVDIDVYQAMLASSLAAGFDGTGAIINRVTQAELPVTGLVATVAQEPALTVFYDGTDPLVWSNDVTGPLGAIWVPGVAPGAVDMIVNDGTTNHSINGIPVDAAAVTFMFTDFP